MRLYITHTDKDRTTLPWIIEQLLYWLGYTVYDPFVPSDEDVDRIVADMKRVAADEAATRVFIATHVRDYTPYAVASDELDNETRAKEIV